LKPYIQKVSIQPIRLVLKGEFTDFEYITFFSQNSMSILNKWEFFIFDSAERDTGVFLIKKYCYGSGILEGVLSSFLIN
jgi:hypothetical protein